MPYLTTAFLILLLLVAPSTASAQAGVSYQAPVDNPFVGVFQQAVEEANLSPILSGFGAHSDIGLPTGLGNTPTVNFGPGDPAQAHQPNERVSVRDLVDCTKAIAIAIEKWCR